MKRPYVSKGIEEAQTVQSMDNGKWIIESGIQDTPAVAPLELVFLEGFERGRPSTERVIFGDPIEYVNAAVVQQGRLRDCAFGWLRAYLATLQRRLRDFLNGFEAVTPGTLIFVKGHEDGWWLAYPDCLLNETVDLTSGTLRFLSDKILEQSCLQSVAVSLRFVDQKGIFG